MRIRNEAGHAGGPYGCPAGWVGAVLSIICLLLILFGGGLAG